MNANELTVHQLQGWCHKQNASVSIFPDGTIYGAEVEAKPFAIQLSELADAVSMLADVTPEPQLRRATDWPDVQQAAEPAKAASALDVQVGGGHYKDLAIQPMEYSMANKLDACQHTVVKYVTRFRDKGGIQDLLKAKHVLDMLIEFEAKAGRTPAAANDNQPAAVANG